MISYSNILYCTDFSEDAEIAFIHAVDMAKRHGAKLHVLHTLQTMHRYSPTETSSGQEPGEVGLATPELIAQTERKIKDHYQSRLEGIKQVTYSVMAGTPFVEILRYARDYNIDLIVMGAAGVSEYEPTHYGSTVDQVSRRANCAVMAIRNPEKTYTL